MPRGKKATDTPTQSRYWVFTINNPIDTDAPEHWLFEQDINYLVYQEEIGAENTHHYQGYVEFTKLMRLTALKKLSPRAHWEGRRGTRAECIAYCTKLETRKDGTEPYIFQKPGKIDEEGKKDKSNKFDALRESIKNGASIKEIAETNFTAFLRYHRGLQLYETSILTPRNFKTLCIAIYGPTGTGKSSFNKKFFPDAYWKPKNMWWDEYSQQDVVAIDEFYGWLRYDFLLRLLDRYPLQCPTKGSSVNFRAKYVFFTSNSEIDSWYNFRGKMSLDALKRRIDFQACMDEHGTLTVLKGAFDFTRSYSGCGYIDSVGAGETLPVAQAQQEHAVRNTSPPRRTTLVLDESSSSDMMPDIGDSQEDNTEEAKEAAISVLNRSNAFLYENYDAFAMSRTNFSDPEKSDSIEVEADHSPVLNYYMDFTSSDSDCEEQSPTEAQLRTDDIINYRPRLTAKAPPSKRRKLFD